MPIFIPIPEPIEAYQWFKNGDIPGDGVINGINSGSIVGRHSAWKQFTGAQQCPRCGTPIGNHGVITEKKRIANLEFVVCPSDWVIVKRDPYKRIIGVSTITNKKIQQYYINMKDVKLPQQETK